MQLPLKNGGVDTKGSPDEIVQVAYAEDVAYGLAVDGRLRKWELADGTLRDVPGQPVSQLATDGSVAVSTSWSGAKKIATIAIRELATGRTIAEQRFELGARVQAVSRSVAVLTVRLPVVPESAAMQILPPTEEQDLWDLVRGHVSRWYTGEVCHHGDTVEVSADGARILCGSGFGGVPALYDRALGRVFYPPSLAPDWTAEVRTRRAKDRDRDDDDDDDEDDDDRAGGDPDAPVHHNCPKCSVRTPRPTTWVVSTLLGPDGNVYLTYHEYQHPHEWRLERWIPGATEADHGRFERLAVRTTELATDRQTDLMRDLADEVLAVSPDGAAVVTGGRRRLTTMRRGPRFAAERIPMPSANAAAFSPDGTRVLTGHESGRMYVWDTTTLRQLAASAPRD